MMTKPNELPAAAECRSCGKLIAWYPTKSGKKCPVDMETVEDPKAVLFDPKKMKSHFATCPQANNWRKPK